MYEVYTFTKTGQEVWGQYSNILTAHRVAGYVRGHVRKI